MIHTGLASLLPPVDRFAVVRNNLSRQERQQVALGIFMSLEEQVESGHELIERLTFGKLVKSGYALEDLPSDLIGFYVAWMTKEKIDSDQLREKVGPICHVLNKKDSLHVFKAFEESGLLYEKNRQWAPLEIPESCSSVQKELAEKCADVDARWPPEFSGITPEPAQEAGKWWWWKGPWREAHIEPSEYEGVYLYDVPPPTILELWAAPPIVP